MSAVELAQEAVKNKVKDFISSNERVLDEVVNMIIQHKRSLEVDFNDVLLFDKELADLIVERPKQTLPIADSAVREVVEEKDPETARRLRRFYFRVKGSPYAIPLRRLRSEYIGRLIRVEGIVTRQTPPKHFLYRALYRCTQCGYELELVQELEKHVEPPPRCPKCGATKSFMLVTELSQYIDWQKLIVQERPEELPPGQLPRSIEVILLDDQVDTVKPGDIVSITGVLDLTLSELKRGRPPILSSYLQSIYIESTNKEMIEDITRDDEKKILELARRPDVRDLIVRSIAPSIYGHEEIKEAIACLLFGGNEIVYPDGVRVRGDIHVLLVGDPGTAKSQLLKFVAKVAPRAVYTTGKGSSAAGLTAAVVRDKLTGDFYLEAGALVLADRGVAVIDEIDKMDVKDRVSIHEAMEQQTVSISKAGIVATLNARAAVVAAANPAFGRYLPNRTVAENIDLPVSLLSRFDLIFVVRDEPQEDYDKAVAGHILDLHTGSLPESFKEIIKPDLLRKYIIYARRHVKPQLSEEAKDKIRQFYLEMRRRYQGPGSAIAITARQLEALIRLTIAEAKMRLSPIATAEDAERAIRLYLAFLKSVGIDMESGVVDIDSVMTGVPASRREAYIKLSELIRRLEEAAKGPVKLEVLLDEAEKAGVPRADAQRLVELMIRNGELYTPRPGYVKRING
ncbi:minichromosome maintenance protein MCM [Thermoproteus tenax]|uniref:DNA helicase n=1 Tax=Thermoproteus tenax (strain ATCC 35583 / DSM 2078 / JCM 9277 / NBRC 100435 / Kra 1) TaxID=768679 RepID=G4RN06_THETK|nr:minichromosome maintenance protein MCM [Thermoproteus tenax]CCC80950.1 cell division control protein [Thermoproteus tenax Kra 1]